MSLFVIEADGRIHLAPYTDWKSISAAVGGPLESCHIVGVTTVAPEGDAAYVAYVDEEGGLKQLPHNIFTEGRTVYPVHGRVVLSKVNTEGADVGLDAREVTWLSGIFAPPSE